MASCIFRHAVATSRATSDPTALLGGALAAPKVKHHSAVVDPRAVGDLKSAQLQVDLYSLPQTILKRSAILSGQERCGPRSKKQVSLCCGGLLPNTAAAYRCSARKLRAGKSPMAANQSAPESEILPLRVSRIASSRRDVATGVKCSKNERLRTRFRSGFRDSTRLLGSGG